MYDPMLKHMPRNIQEIHNPKLKRDRLAQEKLERVMLNIQRRYGNEFGRIIIKGAKEKDLDMLVGKIVEEAEKEVLGKLHQLLRGDYPILAKKVYYKSRG